MQIYGGVGSFAVEWLEDFAVVVLPVEFRYGRVLDCRGQHDALDRADGW